MADRPAIELEPGYPPEAMYSKPISYEATIKSRRKNKIHSLGNASVYQYSGNKNLVFQMGSNDAAVDFLSSFIQFTLKTKGLYETDKNDYRRYLAYGGLHALFRTCEITTLSNSPIERKNNYNATTAFFQKLYQNPKELDGSHFLEGAGIGKEPYNWEELGIDGYSFKVKGEVNGATIAAEETVTMDNHTIQTQLAPGDEVLFRDATSFAPVHKAVVVAVSASGSHTFTISPTPGVAIADNSTVWRKPLPPRVRLCRPEEGALTATAVTAHYGLKVSFKPFMFLFLMDTYFPMWLVDGIQIKFELEQPERAIILSERYAPATTASVDYSISDAYLQIQSVVYDDATKNAWETQWRSPEGLLFQMRRYIYEQQIWQATATNFSLPISIEALSIREAFCFIQSEKSVTSTVSATNYLATQIYDNHANYYDAGLDYYQFRQGANYFPPAPVFVNDANGIDLCMTEAYNELLETLGAMGMNANISIPWSKWLKENPSEQSTALTTLAADHSRRAIFAANLSAYHGFMGGLYTRNNRTIYIDFLFDAVFYLGTDSGASANRVFNTIFGTDAVLQIQKDLGVIVYG